MLDGPMYQISKKKKSISIHKLPKHVARKPMVTTIVCSNHWYIVLYYYMAYIYIYENEYWF